MANPPPPYSDITGISRSVMKDNSQETIPNYDGNARPGELVVDLSNNDIYIGNTNGNLNLISTGGGGAHADPSGPVSSVQLNAGGNLFTGSANLTFVNNTLSVIGNVNSTNVYASSNIVAVGNVTASYGIFSGGNTVINSTISTTGNVIGNYFLGNGSQLTGMYGNANVANYLPTFSGNITANFFSAAGNVTGNYVIASGGNTVINAGISTTGNVTANYFIGNGNQLTGVITTILPSALSNTVHIAANTVGNTATIITDATTANVANTIVVRDQYGAINVNAWAVNTRLVAANTTATTTDYWIGLTAKNLTVTLPNAANGAYNGRQYQIADTVHSGNPGDYITAQTPATTQGNDTVTQQGQIVTVTYVNGVWYCN